MSRLCSTEFSPGARIRVTGFDHLDGKLGTVIALAYNIPGPALPGGCTVMYRIHLDQRAGDLLLGDRFLESSAEPHRTHRVICCDEHAADPPRGRR